MYKYNKIIKIKVWKNQTVFSEIKEYAEEHAALFTAICSGIVAFLTVVLKLCYFSYQYGKATAFNLNINAIDLIKDTTIFNILFYIVLAGIMITSNYFGYLCYRKNTLTIYLIVLLIMSIAICPILLTYTLNASFLDIIKDSEYRVLILVLSLFFVPAINSIVLINALTPSISDLYYRLEDKYNKIIDKYDIDNINEQKHIKKCNKKLKKLLIRKERIIGKRSKQKPIKILFSILKLRFISYNNTKEFNSESLKKENKEINDFITEYKLELKNKSDNKKTDIKSTFLINLITISITIVVMIVFLFALGYVHSSDIMKIDIIENTNYFVENGNKLDCAIIYENNEYLIVSPCYEKDNQLIINTSYQYRTENSNITKHLGIYDNVTITQFDDLTEWCKQTE